MRQPPSCRWRWALLALLGALASASAAGAPALRVLGDGIPEPLAATAGDPARGLALLVRRESANCVLCHVVPDPAIRFSGDVGPPLAGIGARLSAAQLRLRIADYRHVKSETIMPSYFSTAGFERVAVQYRDRTILTAAEVEDIVSYLQTLQ
jgi:L-cysteine S-thiosulfotransferase